jgi:hypothetical protein
MGTDRLIFAQTERASLKFGAVGVVWNFRISPRSTNRAGDADVGRKKSEKKSPDELGES